MTDFDKGENKIILDAIHETHPFTYFSPNIQKATSGFTANDYKLLFEISMRLKYNSGSFLLKNDRTLQLKMSRDVDEIHLSIRKLIDAGIISVIDEHKNIYQANPIMMWKGSMQTLLDRNKELYSLCTFTMQKKYDTADELTAKRVIEVIKKTQSLLHPVDENPDTCIADLNNEEWVNIHDDECQFISNKGRVKYSYSPGGKEKIKKIEFGRVTINGKSYNLKALMKEHFPEL
jgi:hypothetical protein